MQSPVIAELARIPLTSKIKPASARIGVLRVRCTVLAYYLSLWIDGDAAHREPPPDAGLYSRDRQRSLMFRHELLGEEFALQLYFSNVNQGEKNVR